MIGAVCLAPSFHAWGTADGINVTGVTHKNRITLPISPRFQWQANFGYCGETALISAGLYYGQYVSQYNARAYASKNKNQNEWESQLLLGVNETTAAKAMHLNIEKWNGNGVNNFLAWAKKNIIQKHPVVIGIYQNMSLFEDVGNAEYDHIVPIIGIGTNHSPTDYEYYADDIIYISDNGLIGDNTPTGSKYIYNYSFNEFQRTRTEADQLLAPTYSIAKLEKNYGFAVTGVKDTYNETVPVSLKTNVNYEDPSILDGKSARPTSTPITLTITVSKLKPGVIYYLYRYNNIEKVPNGSFNSNASNAIKTYTIKIESGSTFTTSEDISSDEIAVYRAVPAAAR